MYYLGYSIDKSTLVNGFSQELLGASDYANNHGYILKDDKGYLTISEAPVHERTIEEELSDLHYYLDSTDKYVVKCMELGLSMAEEYPEMHQKRAEARARINQLENAMER